MSAVAILQCFIIGLEALNNLPLSRG